MSIYVSINSITIINFIVHVFGAGHLRGSPLLSFFASYYQHNIGWGVGPGGVGWGGIIASLARPHIRDATELYALLNFIHMLCYCRFSCTSTLTPIYVTVGSLALPHIRHATLLWVLLHFHTTHICHATLLLRFSCTSTHTSFYATVGSLALPHTCHATLL